MSELNPNHPVTKELHEQWHKLCAIVMYKCGLKQVDITSEDIDSMMNSGLANITMKPSGNVLKLALVSDAEAERLARKEGGLPV